MTHVTTKARAGLDRRTVKEIKEFLEARRVALLHSVRNAMKRTGASDAARSTEPVAQATETLLDEMQVALADRQSRVVAQIDAALEGLGRGEYGLCRDCGASIGLARLKALPFAQRCRPCQGRAEQEERHDAERARLGALAAAELT